MSVSWWPGSAIAVLATSYANAEMREVASMLQPRKIGRGDLDPIVPSVESEPMYDFAHHTVEPFREVPEATQYVNLQSNMEAQQPNLHIMLTMGKFSSESMGGGIVTVESWCKNHPQSTSYVHVKPEVTVSEKAVQDLKDAGCKIEVVPYDIQTAFKGTPLEEWIAKDVHELENGKYWMTHEADMFRLAVLFRYGGWYLDTDVIVLKPVGTITNAIGMQTDGYLNNAISVFEVGSPFLHSAMESLLERYKPDAWSIAGPDLVHREYQEWPNQECSEADCVSIIPAEEVMPVPWYNSFKLWNSTLPNEARSKLAKSTMIHWWNQKSHSFGKGHMVKNTALGDAYVANCVTCKCELSDSVW